MGSVPERSPPARVSLGRRLAVPVILVTLVGAGWWSLWPRIDPRFIGHWDWYDAANGYPKDLTNEEFICSIEMRPDGSETATFPDGRCSESVWWTNSAGQVEMIQNVESMGRPRRLLRTAYARVAGEFDDGILDRWLIREVTAERIVLESATMSDSYVILRRSKSKEHTTSVRKSWAHEKTPAHP